MQLCETAQNGDTIEQEDLGVGLVLRGQPSHWIKKCYLYHIIWYFIDLWLLFFIFFYKWEGPTKPK